MRRYLLAIGGIALATLLLEPFHAQISTATVALSFLLVILFTATFLGRNPALLGSLAGMLCFNYFFLPTVRTWTISNGQNLIAWGAFTVTAVVAGQLSAYARRRAEEAERGRAEIERLYRELQNAFEQASKTEALRQSEKLKSALLDAVTHDLRTPLTSIKAAVTTLIDDEKPSGDANVFKLGDEGKQEFLEIINEETDRLNNFIEGMVELARQEAGALSLRRNWSAVDSIINAALTRAERILQNHPVKLEIERELPVVRVDAKTLAEVVYTLLDNAAKYSPANSPIKIVARRAENDRVEIAVADEGRGIPAELRGKVFDKFFRADLEENEKNTVGGLGLGLAIARGIVESHGGQIRIETGDNGKGTTVIFTVPIGDE